MRLLVFNPENDMALADGSVGYTPPASIRRFRREHCMLPQKWAQAGDYVWDGVEALDGKHVTEVCPWGWSKAIVHELVKAGVERDVMPSDDWLDGVRQLSSRAFTVGVQQELGLNVRLCKSWREVAEFSHGVSRCVMKSLWSCSGKGLMLADKPNAQAWMERVVARDGAVACEQWIGNKAFDFALEYTISAKGDANYDGLSVFRTAATGRYLHQLSGKDAERRLLSVLSEDKLSQLRTWWQHRLEADDIRRFNYFGPMGIDMLVTSDGEVCPCVELNWRMTMGHVVLCS